MERLFLAAENDLATRRVLDVRADDTDARDYIFEPKLDLLPAELAPPRSRLVLDQEQEGACVGFALATVINTSLIRRNDGDLERGWERAQDSGLTDDDLASERMLYEMGRRHDEWEGEQYEGTSLRGAMKGWHKHGVCSRESWPYVTGAPGTLDDAGREDARRRPLGAYYRILDSDVLHVQAAIHEGDSVLASVWIHSGWRRDVLAAAEAHVRGLPVIPFRSNASGLHAVALVGYERRGFVVQNSWGEGWGHGGLALLGYDDWFRNRQDAWVARPGTETLDQKGKPQIFLVGFAGGGRSAAGPAGTAGADGLGIDRAALAHIINTGDRGALSTGGRLETPAEHLPGMAAQVRLTPEVAGARHVMLYAHGGLVAETKAARRAAQLFGVCSAHQVTGYFFVWETGKLESLLGLLRSRDDGRGERAGFDLGSVAGRIGKAVRKRLRRAQKGIGRAVAPAAREGWREMKGRARGAALRGVGRVGGARLFAEHLFAEMTAAPGAPFKLHLFAHSAGSIYLARLYEEYLRGALAAAGERVQLESVQLFAPALSVELAARVFSPQQALPLPAPRFRIHVLSDEHEESDGIGVYPSSLLTYVADHLEHHAHRVPILGIRRDLASSLDALGGPTVVEAARAERHGEFDDAGYELEQAIETLAAG